MSAASVRALTPGLLAGLALRPLPPSLLRRLSRPVLARLRARLAPRLGDRLEGLSGRVAVVPAGHPVAVVATIADGTLFLDVDDADAPADAVVRAPLEVLAALTDTAGLDGDATFFSRALTIEGDTGLVMALRYALEDADAGPADLMAALPAPARPMLARGTGLARRLHAAGSRDLALVQDAALAPLRADLARQEARLARVEAAAKRRR
ncbi:SCP2 sterol-binding domain-containing protein [Caenispirillum salinarum]|uniref:SCP2 sterol-binding domain-containing protein n=1 Tax=Caenispirillum salinarum TaxID=859058 RepID=UPI0038511037